MGLNSVGAIGTTWGVEEAPILTQILQGEHPYVDAATWAAFTTLVEAAAARRAGYYDADGTISAALARYPTETQRRRYGGHGDVNRWVAHGEEPCPAAPCVGADCPARHGFRGRDPVRAVA